MSDYIIKVPLKIVVVKQADTYIGDINKVFNKCKVSPWDDTYLINSIKRDSIDCRVSRSNGGIYETIINIGNADEFIIENNNINAKIVKLESNMNREKIKQYDNWYIELSSNYCNDFKISIQVNSDTIANIIENGMVDRGVLLEKISLGFIGSKPVIVTSNMRESKNIIIEEIGDNGEKRGYIKDIEIGRTYTTGLNCKLNLGKAKLRMKLDRYEYKNDRTIAEFKILDNCLDVNVIPDIKKLKSRQIGVLNENGSLDEYFKSLEYNIGDNYLAGYNDNLGWANNEICYLIRNNYLYFNNISLCKTPRFLDYGSLILSESENAECLIGEYMKSVINKMDSILCNISEIRKEVGYECSSRKLNEYHKKIITMLFCFDTNETENLVDEIKRKCEICEFFDTDMIFKDSKDNIVYSNIKED